MENTIENNRLIAEFMGMQYRDGGEPEKLNKEPYLVNNGDHLDLHKLAYHTDWNWLMPVLLKIGGLGFYVHQKYSANMSYCSIWCDKRHIEVAEEYNETCGDILETTYKAVIEFINWYNSNQPPTINQ